MQGSILYLPGMGTLICIALASFAVLAQPAAAQGTNTTLPLTYPGQVLQDGSQTCHSEAQRRITRNEKIWNNFSRICIPPTYNSYSSIYNKENKLKFQQKKRKNETLIQEVSQLKLGVCFENQWYLVADLRGARGCKCTRQQQQSGTV